MINYLLIDMYSLWMWLVFPSGKLIEDVFSSTLVLSALLHLPAFHWLQMTAEEGYQRRWDETSACSLIIIIIITYEG